MSLHSHTIRTDSTSMADSDGMLGYIHTHVVNGITTSTPNGLVGGLIDLHTHTVTGLRGLPGSQVSSPPIPFEIV